MKPWKAHELHRIVSAIRVSISEDARYPRSVKHRYIAHVDFVFPCRLCCTYLRSALSERSIVHWCPVDTTAAVSGARDKLQHVRCV